MASMPRMICLCISLAAVWAYFTKLAAPEPLIGAFFSGLLGALFLGAKPAESKKVKKQAVKRDDTSVEDNETDEDDEDDEDFKQIGLDIAKENIVPAGSRRTSKLPEKYREELFILPVKGIAGPRSPAGSRTPAESPKSPKNGESFDVESIVDRKSLNGQVLYLVKWKGFEDDQNTWEPLKNLAKVMHLVEEYEREIEMEAASKKRGTKRKTTKPPPTPASPPKTPKTSARSTPAKRTVPQSAPPKSSKTKETPPPKKTSRKSMAPKASNASSIKKAPPAKSPPKTRMSTRGGK